MDISKLSYLPCSKGGIHTGQNLNMVCLNQYCYGNPLCCCACIQEFHQGHKTKTLKTLLVEADELAKNSSASNKQSAKQTEIVFNSDIMYDMINQNQLLTKAKFKEIRHSINKTIDQIEQNLSSYYTSLIQTLQNKDHKKTGNLSTDIRTSIQNLIGSSQFVVVTNSVQKLLNQMAKVGNDGVIYKIQNQPQSIINLINQSNEEVNSIVSERLTQVRNDLTSSSDFLYDSTLNITHLWDRQIYRFSMVYHNTTIDVIDSNVIKSAEGQQYQMALLQPSVQLGNSTKAFRFKVKKLTANWMAVGICHLKTVEQKDYIFQYDKLGHGAYMISANGGTWSSTTANLNNRVKSFNFGQGDSITCIVNSQLQSIFFVKEVSISQAFSTARRQIYQLPFTTIPGNQIYPCATVYYLGDQIQYLPVTNMSYLPKYEYQFSELTKHLGTQITKGRIARAISFQTGQSCYRACILNKSLQEGEMTSYKTFSFRIIYSSADWVAVGMCHHKTAINNAYQFNYQLTGHGYYMISSNGGSWSTIDQKCNNVVRSFKFFEGDAIECIVQFGESPDSLNNQIVFKKGDQRYSLNFKGIQGDKLYPCVMLHYNDDQVSILPQF